MSVPPLPPPEPPPDATRRSKKEPRQGALTAFVVIVLVSMMIGSAQGIQGVLIVGLTVAPVVALVCVLLGSILTIFKGTRRFASGFLIASAILMIVTAGTCVAIWSSI